MKGDDHLQISLRFLSMFFFFSEILLLSAKIYQCNIAMSNDDEGVHSLLFGHILDVVPRLLSYDQLRFWFPFKNNINLFKRNSGAPN